MTEQTTAALVGPRGVATRKPVLLPPPLPVVCLSRNNVGCVPKIGVSCLCI